jgi:glycosyltransferase involved in cell wall biosynthesis
MKIAAIHNFLDKQRGAERAFLKMVLALKASGHEVDVFVLGISEYFAESLKDADIRVVSLNFNAWGLNYIRQIYTYFNIINEFRLIFLYRKTARQINESTYDCAFISHFYLSPLILPLLSIPAVYYCHEPNRLLFEPPFNSSSTHRILRLVDLVPREIDKRIEKHCARSADMILTNSDYSRECILRAYGILPVTNRLGVDLDVFKKIDVGKENIVISLGALQRAKAHDFVIRSIGLISPEKRPRLLIIGSGSIKKVSYYFSLAGKYNVALQIKSNIADEELVALYSKARIFAISYIREPSIEPEALGCELPIVAVKEGGVSETVIHNETGILTNRDEKEFAQAIEYLLDNPDKASEMGRKGREWIEKNFTWEMCAENLEKNFNKVLRESADQTKSISISK